VFNAIVNRWHLIRPAGLDVAVLFSVCFWLVAIIAAASWQRRFGIGPAEWVYRKFGGTSTSATTGEGQPYSTSLNVSH